ncbi:unnamed protein product, partial [Ectocarpus sp. 13 AM-2016]
RDALDYFRGRRERGRESESEGWRQTRTWATKERLRRSSLGRRVPSSCGRFHGEEVRRPRQTGLCYSTKETRRSGGGGVEKEPLTTKILLFNTRVRFVRLVYTIALIIIRRRARTD